MTPDEKRSDQARHIIDANQYMVLGTADVAGDPWASPVWFAHDDYREFVGSHRQRPGILGTSPSGRVWAS